MSDLADAIKKAEVDQYRSSIISPGLTTLIKAHKKSERQRWVEHYLLQIMNAGFIVVPAGTLHLGEPMSDPRCVWQEFQFHPLRKWRFDFAIPAIKLAVEIDGGVWRRGGGAHSHPTNIMRDIEKSNAAAMLGWRLLRFTDREIRSLESIRMTSAIATRGSSS